MIFFSLGCEYVILEEEGLGEGWSFAREYKVHHDSVLWVAWLRGSCWLAFRQDECISHGFGADTTEVIMAWRQE